MMSSDASLPERLIQGNAVTWFGHACFRITDDAGHTVIIDPYVEQVMGQSLKGLKADVAIATHDHYDHNDFDSIDAPHVIHALSLIEDGQVKRVGDAATGIVFTLIPTYHDKEQGAARGQNAVILWEEGGVKFCHAGDLGQEFSAEQAALIGRPDVLMLPIGGYYTIDGKEARQIIAQLRPHIAIPMHYKVPGMTNDDIPIATIESFLTVDGQPAPWSIANRLDSPTLMVDPEHLPPTTEVDVLQVAHTL